MPGFKALIIICSVCWMLGCKSQDTPPHEIQPDQLEKLQGTWTLSHEVIEVIEDLPKEELTYTEWGPPQARSEPLHLRIVGNRMQVFQFPLEYYGAFALGAAGGKHVKRGHFKNTDGLSRGVETIHISQDSLFRTVAVHDYWITSHYFRDSLNEDTLDLLVRDSVNATVLYGKWKLDSIIAVDYDEDFVLNLPFEISDTLSFSQNDHHQTEGRITYIKVDSTLRPFRVGFWNRNRIWVKPTDWFSHGLPPIEYGRDYFISLAEYNNIGPLEQIKHMEIASAANIYLLLGDEDSKKTIKTTNNPKTILPFLELLSQLSHKGNGKKYQDRPDNLPAWRIRFVDHKDLWHNILFIGNKIETPVGSPGEYYVDKESIKRESSLFALVQAFMLNEE